jgi:hypothetical protein
VELPVIDTDQSGVCVERDGQGIGGIDGQYIRESERKEIPPWFVSVAASMLGKALMAASGTFWMG